MAPSTKQKSVLCDAFAGLSDTITAARDSENSAGSTDELDYAIYRRIESVYDNARYLDALEIGRQNWGPDLRHWRSMWGRIMASRLAGWLGGESLRSALLFDVERRFMSHPAGRYFGRSHQLGRKPAAEMWLTIRDEDFPSDDPIWLSHWTALQGSVLAAMRDFDRGLDRLDQAIAMMPEDPYLHVCLGRAHISRDDWPAAETALRCAMRINPRYGVAVQSMTHLLTERGRVDEAFELLERSVTESQSASQRLQLATMYQRRDEHRLALEWTRRAKRYLPLIRPPRQIPDQTETPDDPPPERRYSIAADMAGLRSDSLYHLGDIAGAIREARRCGYSFQKSVADNLQRVDVADRRVRWEVPYVRQSHVTCAPATLTMLCRYFNVDADHDQIAAEICYDGTPSVRTRVWAEQKGLVAREFTVTWDAATELLDRGVPFALTTVAADMGHIQVVCGYDARRGTLLIQDPGSWHINEILGKDLIDGFAAFGPRGLLLHPSDRHDLHALSLPDSDRWDGLHRIDAALLVHDRPRAAEEVDALMSDDPNGTPTLWGLYALAAYDGNAVIQLAVVRTQRKNYPDNELLKLREIDLLRQSGRSKDVLSRLRALVADGGGGPPAMRELAEALEGSGEAAERRYWIRRVLRLAPHDAGGLFAESRRRWEYAGVSNQGDGISAINDHNRRDADRRDAVELARLASMSAERNEQMASTYLSLSRRIGQADEALAVLADRFKRHGDSSGRPAVTYAAALANQFENRRAIDVLEQAIQRRPDDGELRCDAAGMLLTLCGADRAAAMLQSAPSPLPPIHQRAITASIAESDGRWDDALQCYQQIAVEQPTSANAVQDIARTIYHIHGSETATQYVLQQAERYPHHRGLLTLAVQTLTEDSRWSDALVWINRLIAAHPSNAWAMRERALTHLAIGRFKAARQDAEAADRIEPSAMSSSVLGDIAAADGRISDAMKHFQRSILHDVDHVFAIRSAWSLIGRHEGNVVAADDNQPAADTDRADTDRADTDRADPISGDLTMRDRRSFLQFIHHELIRQRTVGEALATYAMLAEGELPPDTLIHQYQRLRDARPDLLEAALMPVYAYRKFGQYNEATRELKRAASRFDTSSNYWLQLAELSIVGGHAPAAIEYYRRAIRIEPGWSHASVRMAAALRGEDRFTEAVDVLESAISRRPHDVDLMVALADLRDDRSAQVRDPDAAGHWLRRAALSSPGSDLAWERFVDHHRRRGTGEEAITIVQDNVDPASENYQLHQRAAEVYAAFGRDDQADASLVRAERASPDSSDVRLARMQRLAQRGQFDRAIELGNADGVDPRFRRPVELYATRLLRHIGRHDQARQRLHDILNRQPGEPEEWTELADWCEADSDLPRYDQVVDELVRRAPHLAISYAYRHSTRLRHQDREGAKCDLEHALKIDPAYTYAATTLVNLAIEDSQYDRADAALEAAGDAIPIDTYHALRCRVAKQRGDASQWIERLSAIPEPSDQTQVDPLSIVAYAWGDIVRDDPLWIVLEQYWLQATVRHNETAVAPRATETTDPVGSNGSADLPGAVHGNESILPARAIGTAWAYHTFCRRWRHRSIRRLKRLPHGAAWNGAAAAVANLASSQFNHTTTASSSKQLAIKVAKLAGARVLQDADLYAAIVHGQCETGSMQSAFKLSKLFEQVDSTRVKNFAPSMRCCVEMKNPQWLNQIITTKGLSNQASDVVVAQAALSLRSGRFDDFDHWMADADLSDVHSDMRAMAAIVEATFAGVQTGDESSLLSYYNNHLRPAGRHTTLKKIHIQARRRIALATGRKWKARLLWLYT